MLGLSFLLCFALVWLLPLRVAAQADPPVIVSFSPASGTVGSTVTLQGANFTQATSVQFGTVAAEFSVFDAQQIVVTVPAGATKGPITVVTPGGTAVSAGTFVVLQNQPPVLHQFVPSSGSAGTEVMINGEFLAGTTGLSFNGVAATFREGFSGTNLVAVVPTTATTGPISVSTPFGTYTTTTPFTVTTTPPPEITSFAPESGSIGTRVVLNGNNFTGVTAVRFNGVPADFTLFGNTITAFVPNGAATGPITIVTVGGTGSSASSFVVTAPGAPAITSLSPTRGRPGITVTISGQNLESATSVTFNGMPASFGVFGLSILTTVPAGATTGPLTVVTPNGSATSSGPFTVVDPQAPEITNFIPATGAVGATVTITGTNFTGVTEVRFGGAATTFVLISDTELRANVPSGATTGEIVVTTARGTTVSSDTFYVPAQILSFEPSHGPVGTPVTLRGMNLTGTFAVLFGGVGASFTSISPAEIRAIVPDGASSGAISIATPAGFANSEHNFLLPPEIAKFEPPSALPASEVTISGDNLLGVSSVRFGNIEASFTPISVTKVLATVPASASNGPITVTTPAGSAISASSFFVGLFSDVTVGLSSFPDSVSVGDFLRYTITVTNRGPLDAADVVVTDRLPAGTELIFLPSGAECSASNNTITCNLGLMPAGTDLAIRVSVTIIGGSYLTNEVTVISKAADPDLINNSTTMVTVLEGAPPLTDVTLSAAHIGNGIELSWPASADGFLLETASSLASAAWTAVPNVPVVVNAKSTVLLPTSTGLGFYRLKQR